MTITTELMWAIGFVAPILIILIRALIYQNVKNKEFNMKLLELDLKIESKFKDLSNTHNKDILSLTKAIDKFIENVSKSNDENTQAHEKVLEKIDIVKDMVNELKVAVAANKHIMSELPKHFDSDK